MASVLPSYTLETHTQPKGSCRNDNDILAGRTEHLSFYDLSVHQTGPDGGGGPRDDLDAQNVPFVRLLAYNGRRHSRCPPLAYPLFRESVCRSLLPRRDGCAMGDRPFPMSERSRAKHSIFGLRLAYLFSDASHLMRMPCRRAEADSRQRINSPEIFFPSRRLGLPGGTSIACLCYIL